MASGAGRRIAAGVALVAALACAPARAADSAPRPDLPPLPSLKNRVFLFSGGDVAGDAFFLWSGVVGAPQGFLHEDGPRFRMLVGAGRYRYRTDAVAGGVNEGRILSGELMAGYRLTAGETVATLFAGAHMENQNLVAPDPNHPAQGAEAGVKVALELYRRLAPDLFATASASASTVHRGYHARAALAREHPSGAAAGIEAAILGDARYREPRAGVFVRTIRGRMIMTLAGGYLSNSGKGQGAYGSLSLYVPY